ncbi:MarR family winged helix-turn-helix transcriptional regulator [Filibacter tadaridae]|uniref:MarR family winged helix-turn-helix transcriptional regulator n=1 Tax=Filibacter tadaridae TaxID=2483811 RepID=UPI000F5345D5|nr:MarR family transcriptional regulator [Filibacter tadaridae]
MIQIQPFQHLFHQLLLLYRPFESRLNELLGKHQIFRGQWSVLHYLANEGSTTLVELSHYLYVEKPTTTRTINRLEELGYVEHVPSRDKREKRMQLTVLGQQVYEEVRITIDAFEKDILTGISVEEQQDMVRIMQIIRANILK